ncbi:hypothetical protein BSKO_00769 [Bryopsis sp. KO-2023]|nr:hypothetical protein BSKO_00769 [Bryopsis sp. KO-2023]
MTESGGTNGGFTEVVPAENNQDYEPRAQEVMVTFRWPSFCSAEKVSVAGDFSNWEPLELRRLGESTGFARTGMVETGTHQYKFLVDGIWRTSPNEPIVRDERNNTNNIRHIHATSTFSWAGGPTPAKMVYLAGSMTSWRELLPMERDFESGGFKLNFCLEPGKYLCRCLVDGKWNVSASEPVDKDTDGQICNEISATFPRSCHIYYSTAWSYPELHSRWLHEDGIPVTEDWEVIPFVDTKSRGSSRGSGWKLAMVAAGPNVPGEEPKLEFFVTDGGEQEDRPRYGYTYVCPVSGGYKLEGGRLKPFGKALKGPVMVVSDLDGTMVENESPEADRASQEFMKYWEDNAALCGSVLVYNTGRSLGQFTHLLQEKMGKLAVPDVVVTAVGTKIFHLESRDLGRCNCSGRDWREDMRWSDILNEEWDLDAVRSVASDLIDKQNDALNWLDYGIEHPHRIALSCRVDVLDYVIEQLEESFKAKGVLVQIITSGTGGWRYVDCVPINGGKLKALEYVRDIYRIPTKRCVAAGDSCNDVLMLQGEHPAIIVGNAQEELQDWFLEQPQQDRVIFTDAPLARGILEGLSRHGFY